MPKMPINYNDTIIYKLCCNALNITDIYVGNTTDFRIRKSSHKSKCNNPNSVEYDFKLYKFIRENGGWDNWSMVLVEKYPCKDSMEARQRTRYWIENLHAQLNTKVPIIAPVTREEKKQSLSYNTGYREPIEYVRQHNNFRYISCDPDARKAYLNTELDCICGTTYTPKHRKTHFLSFHHQLYLRRKMREAGDNKSY